MAKLNDVLNILEDNDFRVMEYREGGDVCGYELERYTDDLGIDMLHFIDCRHARLTAETVAQELTDIYAAFDAQDETANHYNAYAQLRSAGLERILRDMEKHEEHLHDALYEIDNYLRDAYT